MVPQRWAAERRSPSSADRSTSPSRNSAAVSRRGDSARRTELRLPRSRRNAAAAEDCGGTPTDRTRMGLAEVPEWCRSRGLRRQGVHWCPRRGHHLTSIEPQSWAAERLAHTQGSSGRRPHCNGAAAISCGDSSSTVSPAPQPGCLNGAAASGCGDTPRDRPFVGMAGPAAMMPQPWAAEAPWPKAGAWEPATRRSGAAALGCGGDPAVPRLRAWRPAAALVPQHRTAEMVSYRCSTTSTSRSRNRAAVGRLRRCCTKAT